MGHLELLQKGFFLSSHLHLNSKAACRTTAARICNTPCDRLWTSSQFDLKTIASGTLLHDLLNIYLHLLLVLVKNEIVVSSEITTVEKKN